MARELDGFYSWVVAIACSIVYITNFGFQRSTGILFIEIQKVFGVDRQEAAWPFSICSAISSFAGIVCGSMVYFFSPRQIISTGIVFCAISLFLCSFAQSVLWLAIFYGTLFGIGVSAVSPIVPVILNEYFHKYRSAGNGVALSGGSISFFLIPTLTEYLLQIYALRGTFILLSGITIQTLVAAALLSSRLPKQNVRKSKRKDAPPTNQQENSNLMLQSTDNDENDDEQFNNNEHNMEETEIKKMTSENQGNCKLVQRKKFKRLRVHAKEIITDPMFFIVTSSTVMTTYIIVTIGVIIVDYAIDRGFRRETALLLMPTIGIPELLGRLTFGWVGDHPRLQRKHLILIIQHLLDLRPPVLWFSSMSSIWIT